MRIASSASAATTCRIASAGDFTSMKTSGVASMITLAARSIQMRFLTSARRRAKGRSPRACCTACETSCAATAAAATERPS